MGVWGLGGGLALSPSGVCGCNPRKSSADAFFQLIHSFFAPCLPQVIAYNPTRHTLESWLNFSSKCMHLLAISTETRFYFSLLQALA